MRLGPSTRLVSPAGLGSRPMRRAIMASWNGKDPIPLAALLNAAWSDEWQQPPRPCRRSFATVGTGADCYESTALQPPPVVTCHAHVRPTLHASSNLIAMQTLRHCCWASAPQQSRGE